MCSFNSFLYIKILLQNCTDPNYKSFVLEQFKSKRDKMRSEIDSHLEEIKRLREELKIVDETIENITDGKIFIDFDCFV